MNPTTLIVIAAVLVLLVVLIAIIATSKGQNKKTNGTSENERDSLGVQEQKNKKNSLAGEEHKQTNDDEKRSSATQEQMSDDEKEAYIEKKQERVWTDPNEQAKFVCQGGKIQCKYCSPSVAEILPTSTQVMLQDKHYVTVGDKDGKVNFNFTGICKHPSHGSNKPPCKAVINLGEWKDYSDTMIDNYNALLVKSKIPCMISGEDLEIIYSGQIAELGQVTPKVKREPKVIKMYWMDEEKKRRLNRISKGQVGILCVQTKYFLPEETKISIPLKGENGEILETLEGNLDSDGWAYIKWPKIDDKTITEKKPRVLNMYWMDEKRKERIGTVSKGQKVTLCIQTKDFLPEETKISIPLKDEKGEILETLKGNICSNGWAYIKWTNKNK